MSKLGFNMQIGLAGSLKDGTPILADISADVDGMLREALAAFAGENVIVWRPVNRDPRLCLRPPDQGGLPYGAIVQVGNEFDDQASCLGPGGWGRSFVTDGRSLRPDMKFAYGGAPVNAPQYGDDVLLAMCDYVVVHLGVNADGTYFPDRSQEPHGKPVILGELEVDPLHLEALPQLVPASIKALADFDAEYAFLWGASADQANAVMNFGGIDFRAQVRDYNTTAQPSGGTNVADAKTEPEQEQEIQTNFAQVSDLTEALRRIRQGKWTGADGVDGMIVALQGGKPLDFTPSFP